MPNTFAYLMLGLWPVVTLLAFYRLSPLKATLLSILGGYMLLPERTSFNFPMVPELHKESLPALAALAGCWLLARQRVPLLPRGGAERWIVILLLVMPFLTVLNNQEPFRGIPAMRLYDALSYIAGTYLNIIPFLLGMHLVKTRADQVTVLRFLVAAGLLYSLLALYEIRMSPQFHSSIYGMFPHDWRQQIRFGGFRAVVFMRHGLVVSTFFAIAVMAAIVLWKEREGVLARSRMLRQMAPLVVLYLFAVLVLCKSVASIFYATAFFMAASVLSLRQSRLATLTLLTLVMSYPLLSLTGLFPHEGLVNLAATYINELRAQSLAFRFMNEEIMLEHAREKLFFGWGLWGRNRPFSETVTDGNWIIFMSTSGLAGFLLHFGLPALAILRAVRAGRWLPMDEGRRLLVLNALIVAFIMVDQLPNSSLSSWMWLLIGGLMGRATYVLQEQRQVAASAIRTGRVVPVR